MNQKTLDEVAMAPASPDAWIEAGYYPRLPGPAPGVAGPLAVLLANAVVALLPDLTGYVAVNAVLLGLTLVVCFAFQAPDEPIMDRVNVLVLLALALAWSATALLLDGDIAAVARHLVTTANGLLLWLTYHLKAVRHSWWVAVHASDLWDAAGLARYGAFLLGARPGPGCLRVARELYRVACGETLKSGARSRASTEAMTAYADMLEKGQGGKVDRQQAKWWRDQASDQGGRATGSIAPAVRDQATSTR